MVERRKEPMLLVNEKKAREHIKFALVKINRSLHGFEEWFKTYGLEEKALIIHD